MNKKISYGILAGAAVLAAILYIINSHQPDGGSIKFDKKQLYELCKELNDSLSGVKIANIDCVNIHGDSTKLSDLVTGESVLVLHYSELYCSACYQKQFDLLQRFFPDSTKFLVLGSHANFRNFKFYWNRSQYSLPAYCIAYGSLDWYANEYDYPYYFILNKDLTVSYFYVPDPMDIEKNRYYIEYVKKILL